MQIGPLSVGGDSPCRCIAEMSNAHNGDLARAHRIIDAVKASGADFVKFQCYTPDELVALRGDGPAPDPWGSQGWTMRQLYGKAQTPHAWFPELVQHCGDIGLPWFSSVFGVESLALLESLSCSAYKIARLDNRDLALRRDIAATGKPFLVSEAGQVRRQGTYGPPCTLYCPPGYPVSHMDVSLPKYFARDQAGYHLGLSSHCLDPLLPIAAVARGCKLIEMHFMLDDEPSELEASVSLTQTQFAAMVASVRRTEEMLG